MCQKATALVLVKNGKQDMEPYESGKLVKTEIYIFIATDISSSSSWKWNWTKNQSYSKRLGLVHMDAKYRHTLKWNEKVAGAPSHKGQKDNRCEYSINSYW